MELEKEDYGVLVSKGAQISYTGSTKATDVLDQRMGTCVAFAASEALSAALVVQKGGWSGDIPVFSKQELIDGVPIGVDGVDLRHVIAYIMVQGLHFERVYPYVGVHELPCKSPFMWVRPKISFRGLRNLVSTEEVLAALCKSPVVAMMDVYESFCALSYKNKSEVSCWDVYQPGPEEPKIRSDLGVKLRHAVLIVGFGIYGGKLYYIIKNSWGVKWAVNGYCRVAVEMLDSFYEISQPRWLID